MLDKEDRAFHTVEALVEVADPPDEFTVGGPLADEGAPAALARPAADQQRVAGEVLEAVERQPDPGIDAVEGADRRLLICARRELDAHAGPADCVGDDREVADRIGRGDHDNALPPAVVRDGDVVVAE
jgi:hypothetical protein